MGGGGGPMKTTANSKDLEYILELKNITKTFLGGKIVANDDVSLSFASNEIHAIVGENGSGKSTLMNIIFGLYKQDKGDIFVNSKKTNMYESGAAKKHKIGMVHQHFHLVDNFTVLENVILGQEELTKDKVEKKRIKDLKTEFKQVKITMKQIQGIENDFTKKIDKLKEITRRAFKEIEREKNLIQLLKNKRAKISEEKQRSKFNKVQDEIDKREEVIEAERKLLDLISKAKKAHENEDQKTYVELSQRYVDIERELYISDIKLTGAFGKIKKKSALQRLRKIQQKYKIFIDPHAKVGTLAVGQRQMVEILKVL